jgi:hypothetical protein
MRELINLFEEIESTGNGISRNQLHEVIRVALQDECLRLDQGLPNNKGGSFWFIAKNINIDAITDQVLDHLSMNKID